MLLHPPVLIICTEHEGHFRVFSFNHRNDCSSCSDLEFCWEDIGLIGTRVYRCDTSRFLYEPMMYRQTHCSKWIYQKKHQQKIDRIETRWELGQDKSTGEITNNKDNHHFTALAQGFVGCLASLIFLQTFGSHKASLI
jgi:hypothetical protein